MTLARITSTYRLIPFLLLGMIFLFSCRPTAKVRVWRTENQVQWPEKELNLRSTGVCFSGGGTRALCCATGQMKGLKVLDLWSDIGYISAVSGGSWASTIFTYYNAGAQNDEELLGTYIEPGEISMDNLLDISPSFLGYAATRDLSATILELTLKDIATAGILQSGKDIWIDAIGETYLKHFGLYDRGKPRYYTLNDSTMQGIIDLNPKLKLSSDDFYTVHSLQPGDVHRPFLVVNSSLLAPASMLPVNADDMTVFNYTPLYLGSLHRQFIEYDSRLRGKKGFLVGGGFMEPFAMGSKPKSFISGNYFKVKLPERKFRLVDATGTSSSAFAADLGSSFLELFPVDLLPNSNLGRIIPEEKYWPLPDKGMVEATDFRFADGGNLDNFGLLTLLQRQVQKIVVFINTDAPINLDFDPKSDCAPVATDIDSDVYPLFGYPGGNQVHNQVFEKSEFAILFEKLRDARANGKSVMAKTSFKVKENSFWGIQPYQPEILWVYNEQVDQWEDSLNKELKKDLCRGVKGDFKDFPLYPTVGEDRFRLQEFTPSQVNLLYQLSAWNVISNPEMFKFLSE
ncbi:MAG: hypothetical protein H6581_12985 [Bacteroidia bacterium]|nr:hypothetical protein [Bacteroidia bacterium]